jgi:hypothetical protein
MPRLWSYTKRIDNERAIVLCTDAATEVLRVVETEDGANLFVNGGTLRLHLEAEHLHALGAWCVWLFMSERPSVLLTEIRGAAMFAIEHLEAWDARAKADEEHPPYVEINNRLRRIEYLLDQLNKGLR